MKVVTMEHPDNPLHKVLMIQDTKRQNYRVTVEALSSHTPLININQLAYDIAENLREA